MLEILLHRMCEKVLTNNARCHGGNSTFSEDSVVSCSFKIYGGGSCSQNTADGSLHKLCGSVVKYAELNNGPTKKVMVRTVEIMVSRRVGHLRCLKDWVKLKKSTTFSRVYISFLSPLC
jgi:hypothetical protein